MYAIIDYKGQQILVEEGKKIKFPYLKDLKPGSTIKFDQVLYLFDGNKKKIGSASLGLPKTSKWKNK